MEIEQDRKSERRMKGRVDDKKEEDEKSLTEK